MKLSFNIRKRVIDKLYVDGINIINPWGVETADSFSFFSLEEGIGYRHEVISENIEVENSKYEYKIISKMREGKWVIDGLDKIIDENISRKVTLTCLEDSYFMDFVLRFRFRKDFFNFAKIDNRKIEYNYSNVYYQYPVDNVLLEGDKYCIKLSIKSAIIPDGMIPMMYVRDSDNNDEWIIHVRMLPIKYEKVVIKLCNNWYKTMPIPQKLANLILKNKNIKEFLWYHNEKNPYKNIFMRKLNANAFPMIKLKAGTKLQWNVNCEIVKKG